MAVKTAASPRALSKTALNRAIAKQRLWVVVNPFTGEIVASASSRRRVRQSKGAGQPIRQIDVRVAGVRA